jgi:hypothetical protein
MSDRSRKLLLGAIVLLAVLTRGQSAHAHQPTVFRPGTVLVIEDPILSAALYGEFKDPNDVFEAKMTLTKPLAIPLEVLVPKRDALESHRPIFAIVGPGLPAPTDAERALLPRPLPPNTGVIVGSSGAPEREVIFESFTRRVFWTSGPTAYVLPAGEVHLWVFSPGGTRGRFVLGYGVEEGGQDFGNLVSEWDDYAY